MSDSRTVLSDHFILKSRRKEYMISDLVGAGSNAIVYRGFYRDEQYEDLKHQVLIKELFPYVPGYELCRLESGEICSVNGLWEKIISSSEEMPEISSDSTAFHEYLLHKQSFDRANHIHMKLLDTAPELFDGNLDTFCCNHTIYSVLGFSGGHAISRELYDRKLKFCSLREHAQRILRLLDALEPFHKEGLLHLDISPDNILMIGEGNQERISLIDYNSVQTIRSLHSGEAVYLSMKQGFTAPEVIAGRRREIGTGSDLYSVTAVFYWILTGHIRSVPDCALNQTPDLSRISSLQNQPATVVSQVAKILYKGFCFIPARRYRTIQKMRQDFCELIDRIDGIGITHAALWEQAAFSTRHMIRSNPALFFLQDKESLYPLVLQDESGERILLDHWIRQTGTSAGKPLFITGPGGSGKTTALFLLAFSQGKIYREHEAAILYLSLYGADSMEPNLIRNRILEHLHYRVGDSESLENYNQAAAKELFQILSAPFTIKGHEIPKLVLLLDGLNEVKGSAADLRQEILFWSKMPGVRLVLSGRTQMREWNMTCLTLCSIDDKEVAATLKKQGLPPPEDDSLWELLHTPLMLSIYTKTMKNDVRTVSISTKEELLDLYFQSLLQKEEDKESRQSVGYWQNQAAVSYILPACATLIKEKGHALSDQELLPLISKCYNKIRTKDFQKVFPEWIGRSGEILGDTETLDEWYGLMIHTLLWSKFGLLIRDQQNCYRLFHEIASDPLIKKDIIIQENFRKLARRRNLSGIGLTLVLTTSAIGLGCLAYNRIRAQKQYSEEQAEEILNWAFQAYVQACDQNETFRDFLDEEEDTDDVIHGIYSDLALQQKTDYSENAYSYSSDSIDQLVNSLLQDGKAMPWSQNHVDSVIYKDLLVYPQQQKERYNQLKAAVSVIEDDESLRKYYAENLTGLREYLDLEQKVLAAYYDLLIRPEISGLKEEDPEKAAAYYQVLTPITLDIPEDEKEDLRSFLEVYIDDLDEVYYDDVDNMLVVLNRDS